MQKTDFLSHFPELTRLIQEEILRVQKALSDYPKAQRLFANTYPNTLETTTRFAPATSGDQNRIFVFTGDIPAMWLRDSSCQVMHYLPLCQASKELQGIFEGLIAQQIFCLLTDPYANAFNPEPNGNCYRVDLTSRHPLVYERKYEVDSLCYPMALGYAYWKETGSVAIFTPDYEKAIEVILSLWETETVHMLSPYSFERLDCPPSDTLPREGRGAEVAYTGMTWSGFRPSDDACRYGYLIPSQFFALRVLSEMKEILSVIYHREDLLQKAESLSVRIRRGIEIFGIVEHPIYGRIYAYETDGLGHVHLMDDANVPSLLSLPYIAHVSADDPIYQNTRRFVLSPDNPYYYEGEKLRGIGSPHTPKDHIWPIALSMQGLTASSKEEMHQLLVMLEESDGGTGYMHEGVHKDDPARYTRPWFAWSNSLFCEFIYHFLNARS